MEKILEYSWDVMYLFRPRGFQEWGYPCPTEQNSSGLVPKVPNLEFVKQLRPIALCNVVMKVVIKVVANRLKTLMSKLTSLEQRSFIPGRQAANNIILAQEIMHGMKYKQGRKGWMAAKLDLEEAYDRVDWGFLEQVLKAVGLYANLVSLIMKYSLQLFRSSGMVRSWRVLLQYELLGKGPSLAISFCAMHGGFRSENSADDKKWGLAGYLLISSWRTSSHLFFFDDLLLFREASTRQAEMTEQLLQEFCQQSGKKMNLQKSPLIFSRNVPAGMSFLYPRKLGFQK